MLYLFSTHERLYLLGLVLTLLATPAHAASANNDGDPFEGLAQLAPGQLIETLLARNPGIKALEAAAQAAQLRIAPAAALDDPTLTYSTAPETLGGARGLQQQFQFSQPLPWPGKLSLREATAAQGAVAASRNRDDLRLQAIAAAHGLFAEWFYVHRALGINTQHQARLQELRHVAEARYAAGRAGQQDALQAEVARARLAAAALGLEQRRHTVQARMNALLQRPPGARVPPPAALPDPVDLPPLAQLRQRAVQRHPVLARLRARIAEGEAQTALAGKDFYPDFRLTTGYNDLWDDPDKRWSVGISINLPFDYGHKRANARDAAQADLLHRRWQLTEREAQLLSELETAAAAVDATAQTIALYRQRLLPLARDNLEAARSDYRAGSGAFLNVIAAEREQLRTQDDLVRSRAEYMRHLATLERWVGAPLTPLPPIPHQEITP